jgi:hypothetical protein
MEDEALDWLGEHFLEVYKEAQEETTIMDTDLPSIGNTTRARKNLSLIAWKPLAC